MLFPCLPSRHEPALGMEAQVLFQLAAFQQLFQCWLAVGGLEA